MPNTHSWIIYQLDCHSEYDNKTNVVRDVHWRRCADDGKGNSVELCNSTQINYDKSANFVTFDNLTPAIIANWLENELSAEGVANLDAALDGMIEAKINPPIVSPALPWSN
jgi:hypothetical protein